MADYNPKAIDRSAAGAVGAVHGGDTLQAPRFHLDAECVGPDGVKWRDGFKNVVVNQGKGHLLNRVFGSGTASSCGVFVWLHNATTTVSNHGWPDISASRLTAFGNDVPRVTFVSTSGSHVSTSASCAVSFYSSVTTGNQTCTGAAMLFYTANTMSTNAATGDILEYSEGNFAASRLIQPQDTLNVTVTVQYG